MTTRPFLFAAFLVAINVGHGDQPPEFVPLFPEAGRPTGFLVRHWADIFKAPIAITSWTMDDGVLTSTGDRGSWLISEKEYADFVLEYEFKLGPRGNSGLALRAPLRGDPAFDGMELQMADLRYNEQATPAELTGGIYRAIAPSKQMYKPEEWNSMQVTLVGSKLRVMLNGEMVQDADLSTYSEKVPRNDGTLAPAIKDRPRKGHIGFQELSRGESHVQIRNARIKELPAEQ